MLPAATAKGAVLTDPRCCESRDANVCGNCIPARRVSARAAALRAALPPALTQAAAPRLHSRWVWSCEGPFTEKGGSNSKSQLGTLPSFLKHEGKTLIQ